MIITKTEQLNELFAKWPSLSVDETANFIKDGIIQEDLWDNSPWKLAFLLKEMNKGKDGGLKVKTTYSNDLRISCRNDPWPRLGQWAYGLKHAKILVGIKGQTEKEWADAFMSTAVINLKKTAGGSTTDWSVLRDAAENQKERLRKEFEIIDPRIVVCGGRAECDSVFKIARDIGLTSCDLTEPIMCAREKYVSPKLYYDVVRRRVWIDFIHPSLFGRLLKGTTYAELQSLLGATFMEFAATKWYEDVFHEHL